MAYSYKGMSAATSTLNEMLRLNVPTVQKRVFPPGIRRDAQMPRITITTLTPTEKRVGIGELWGANKGVFYNFTFRVDVWDNDPNKVEDVSSEVMAAVWKNRGYTSSDTNLSQYGMFLILEVSGGSDNSVNPGVNLYQRTLNIRGTWLQKSTEKW